MSKTRRSSADERKAEAIARERIAERLATGERSYIIPQFCIEVNGHDYYVDVTMILKEMGAVSDGVNYYRGKKKTDGVNEYENLFQ